MNKVAFGLLGCLSFAAFGGGLAACGGGNNGFATNDAGAASDAGVDPDVTFAPGDGGGCTTTCSNDGTQVVDCNGVVQKTCSGAERCAAGACMAPCDAAKTNRSSVGCDYYAVDMSALGAGYGACFVAFFANTFPTNAKLQASFGGTALDLAKYAKIPSGTGANVTYAAYDPNVGLPPGQVAILFLANDPKPHGNWLPAKACPVPAAIGLEAQNKWTNYGISTHKRMTFHVTSDVPVVGYQMLPYGGGSAALTGATLLLPTSAWDDNYVGASALWAADFQGMPIPPTMAIVAKEDTQVTMLPTVTVKSGYDGFSTDAPPNKPLSFSLKAGETVEFIQTEELTGSAIKADHPVAVFAGHMGLRIPYNIDWSDHAEQQIPPVRAMGNDYAGVSYRDRVPGVVEDRLWRIVGAVDGTTLIFDPPIAGAPSSIGYGKIAEFHTDTPFHVRSQDKDHPFLMFTYMSGSANIAEKGGGAGNGDPDFLRLVPGPQFLSRYVFLTDPTYPETNLVVVRKRAQNGFADVTLDCLGTVKGWSDVGKDGEYQVARVDLSRDNFVAQGSCNNGRHEMTSASPFGVYVWGWGSPKTRVDGTCDVTKPDNSCDVSYAYAAGENAAPINGVVVLPQPK